ncbi:hypothetical protein CLV62_10684 [Dysgonomonas alginatilytica]|uniref:Uncharacterized protein n=1 Tax=Dysgonomonas alginatilytica TaxID=1605892 RepID=A0A2V3PQZ5_9BACT|nr:hypothetical protein [Dysgonomonas alginatilytica]PXV65911.1 hypothetical protein CLV62_10684 [Dysgonomonas alginatilytica]
MKKKLFYFFITTLCLIGFVSCSDDDEDTDIKFLYGSEKVSSVSVTSVDKISVETRNAKGTYTVKSNNEEIATAKIDEYEDLITGKKDFRINIQGIKEGSTSITVIDSENRSATLKVDVIIKTVSLMITSQGASVEAENGTPEDQPAIDKVTEEIKSKLAPIGGGFKLIYASQYEGTLIYYPNIQKLSEKVEGTFKFEGNEATERMILKFFYNNTEYVYDPYGGSALTYSTRTSEVRVVFMRDFTNDYIGMTKPKIKKASGALFMSPRITF